MLLENQVFQTTYQQQNRLFLKQAYQGHVGEHWKWKQVAPAPKTCHKSCLSRALPPRGKSVLGSIHFPYHLQNLSHIVVKICLKEWKLFQGFWQSLQIHGPKILLPSSRNAPCLSLASPSGEHTAASVPLVLMLGSQGNRNHHIMSLPAHLHTCFCQLQLGHGVRFHFLLGLCKIPHLTMTDFHQTYIWQN